MNIIIKSFTKIYRGLNSLIKVSKSMLQKITWFFGSNTWDSLTKGVLKYAVKTKTSSSGNITWFDWPEKT